MSNCWRFWLSCCLLFLTALAFRVTIAHYLANDEPGDGKIYAQMARNLVEQHVYSHATEPPYDPSLIRLPGYPLFLAGVYSLFGHTNNGAVRAAQALLDATSCVLIALIAFYWEPEKDRKRSAALAALGLAALCPFSAIYTATILTETPTIFLAMAMCLTGTLAFRALTLKRSILLWFSTGLIAGAAVFFRPDSGLFAAAVGITLVGSVLLRVPEFSLSETTSSKGRRFSRALLLGAVFSVAFCLVLTPWTLRNKRVFHVFQPLAPAHAEMPGEFVPYGYLAWLRTWIEDERYIGPVLWNLEEAPIDIDELPETAFDSTQEKQEVATLLERYNHPAEAQARSQQTAEAAPVASPQENAEQANASPEATPSETESDEADEENSDESEESAGSEQEQIAEAQAVEMTPEIDEGFARIAHERISRSPLRYYLALPFKRAVSLWFDTHSQYYPFEGELTPFEDLDYEIHQHIWLPLFAGLTWIYTLLGLVGGWLLWRSGDFAARRYVVMTCLMVLLRLGFFSTLENPEPRYVVEVFPFLSILGGIGVARILNLLKRHQAAPIEEADLGSD